MIALCLKIPFAAHYLTVYWYFCFMCGHMANHYRLIDVWWLIISNIYCSWWWQRLVTLAMAKVSNISNGWYPNFRSYPNITKNMIKHCVYIYNKCVCVCPNANTVWLIITGKVLLFMSWLLVFLIITYSTAFKRNKDVAKVVNPMTSGIALWRKMT